MAFNCLDGYNGFSFNDLQGWDRTHFRRNEVILIIEKERVPKWFSDDGNPVYAYRAQLVSCPSRPQFEGRIGSMIIFDVEDDEFLITVARGEQNVNVEG